MVEREQSLKNPQHNGDAKSPESGLKVKNFDEGSCYQHHEEPRKKDGLTYESSGYSDAKRGMVLSENFETETVQRLDEAASGSATLAPAETTISGQDVDGYKI
ncbi:unnamed protein product [Protopolystoma xenopodis]|uniref:Uncharacterized protein n=1 Tax=Protopolystoma xenopodis TaxID=117903 RepID=A0A3S5CH24_9PLAT|nr:unnamed protein product [Protopolystoma xenopodis]